MIKYILSIILIYGVVNIKRTIVMIVKRNMMWYIMEQNNVMIVKLSIVDYMKKHTIVLNVELTIVGYIM